MWCAALPCLAIAAPHDAEVAAVRALYVRFAAEAVVDDPGVPGLADAPPEVLRRHFTSELAQLWRQDRDCVRRTREICRIDFSPIWANPDPVGTTVKLRWDDGRARVVAELRPAAGPKHTLGYLLVRTSGAWRIADIDYGDGLPSLRQRLATSESR